MENIFEHLLKPNHVIIGPFWPEPVRIISIKEIDDEIRIIGTAIDSNTSIDQTLFKENLKQIKIVNDYNLFNADAHKFFLSIEALRYRFASLYDPLLAVSISKIDPLPHQIEAVYGYVLKQPHIRFLIADDPGAGKTIMTGLILKELKLRHIIQRILIVAPGHLKYQWSRELMEKFNESFTIIDRNFFDTNYHSNPWEKENQIITSMDFAKQSDIIESLYQTHFDLVVVDEAHKMTAYAYGDGNKISKSERYKLGEVLSSITTHMLFLTATPHKGDPENFRLFLDILSPGYFFSSELIQQSIENKDNPLFIRRLKEDLKDFDGKPLFLPRHVNTIKFELSNDEKELYNELSKYVENVYSKASDDKKRSITFALAILQRRFASSIHSLLKSLQRRKERLQELLHKNTGPISNLDKIIDDYDDLSDYDREKIDRQLETITLSINKDEFQKEINILNNLIKKAELIISSESEVKLAKLKESLNELFSKIHNNDEDKRKLVVFTEFKDTLDYLTKCIEDWGFKVVTIHGNMNMEQRIYNEKIFKNEADILVATEAAGEGINLQFCNLMINYDIPWNPNRLEQRMGRIHRYGQTREVFIHNFVNTDTREGQVLNKLFDKIEEIKNALGNDKVFDVLGEIIDSKKFKDALIDAAINAKTLDEIIKEIDFEVNEEYIQKVKENLGETLATHVIDYTFIKETAKKAKEHRLIPEYTQNFFIKAFEKAGGKINKNNDNTFKISKIPYDILEIAKNDSLKKNYGKLLSSYERVTFDKEVFRSKNNTEFITFGHPLFEAVLKWVEKFSTETLQTGSVFLDPDGIMNGLLLFYKAKILDGNNEVAGERLFSIFYSLDDHSVKSVPPSIVWDLKEASPDILDKIDLDLESIKEETIRFVLKEQNNYLREIEAERSRQAEIKQKYGIASLNELIRKLDADLIDLEVRRSKGENVDLVIRNKHERKEKYITELEKLKNTIQREKTLSKRTPEFIGVARVMPMKITLDDTNDIMASDAEIEAIGMKIAIDYEISNGRSPEDVSSKNLGYDIKSIAPDGSTRYIEVKARVSEGNIVITQNEWFCAQRLGDEYFLYVVFNASSNPSLHIIQNPTKNLNVEPKFEIVRFVVNKNEILNKKDA